MPCNIIISCVILINLFTLINHIPCSFYFVSMMSSYANMFYFSLIFQICTVQWLNCTNMKYEQKILKKWMTTSICTKFAQFWVVSVWKCMVQKFLISYRFDFLDRFFLATFWWFRTSFLYIIWSRRSLYF